MKAGDKINEFMEKFKRIEGELKLMEGELEFLRDEKKELLEEYKDELVSKYEFEKQFWGNCVNTFGEDQKHYVYANDMGLHRTCYSFQLKEGVRVLDVGGGPTSMLLKCYGLGYGLVVDPIDYPQWTKDRYKMHNIDVRVDIGENIADTGFDEVWIYNCMQHAIDPEKIIYNAKQAAPILRLFEWVDIPAHEGHPHELTEFSLNNWIGKDGFVKEYTIDGCYGKAYSIVSNRK